MKKINTFTLFWIFTGILLLLASLFYKQQSDAIVAQVEPQRIAISFQKAVKIKSIHVIPGQDVKAGDLLVEVVRPDLMYDIDKATNDLNTFQQERDMLITNMDYQAKLTLHEKHYEMEKIDDELNLLQAQYQQNQGIRNALKGIDTKIDTTGTESQNTLLMLHVICSDLFRSHQHGTHRYCEH